VLARKRLKRGVGRLLHTSSVIGSSLTNETEIITCFSIGCSSCPNRWYCRNRRWVVALRNHSAFLGNLINRPGANDTVDILLLTISIMGQCTWTTILSTSKLNLEMSIRDFKTSGNIFRHYQMDKLFLKFGYGIMRRKRLSWPLRIKAKSIND